MANQQEQTVTVTLKFTSPGASEQEHSRTFMLPEGGAPDGKILLAEQVFADVGKELRIDVHCDALAPIDDLLVYAPRTIHANDLSTGIMFVNHNTQEVRRELTNTLLKCKLSLAQSHAYHDIEIDRKNTDAKVDELANLRLNKIEAFDDAINALARLEDLFLLLLFVNLWTRTTSIVDVDFADPQWDMKIKWNAVRRGLADRNRWPSDISDQDHDAVMEVVNSYTRGGALERIANYRNRITHTIHPSIDDVQFSASLSFPRRLPNGATDMSVRWPSTAEFQFTELYADAADALMQVVSLLRRLKSIPRFA